MGFSRQEYWSGLLFPSPGDLPDPGMEAVSLMSPALTGGFFTTSTTWEACICIYIYIYLSIYTYTYIHTFLKYLPEKGMFFLSALSLFQLAC